MPYVDQNTRAELDTGVEATTSGELNYLVTRTLDEWLAQKPLSYDRLNTAIGVLECAKLELYRRIAANYEDHKRLVNGDVYTCHTTKHTT